MKLISLTQGYETMIDDADYEEVSKYKWWWSAGYAIGWIDHKEIRLSHFLIMPPPGLEIDHKDRNNLNNQKYNLRIVTRKQNVINRKGWSSTGYKGVKKNGRKWQAGIGGAYGICLGQFFTPEDAARAYDKAAKEMYGEFAVLNFPGE